MARKAAVVNPRPRQDRIPDSPMATRDALAYGRALAQIKTDAASYSAFLSLPAEHQAEVLRAVADRQARNRSLIKTAIVATIVGYAVAHHNSGPGLFDAPKVN